MFFGILRDDFRIVVDDGDGFAIKIAFWQVFLIILLISNEHRDNAEINKKIGGGNFVVSIEHFIDFGEKSSGCKNKKYVSRFQDSVTIKNDNARIEEFRFIPAWDYELWKPTLVLTGKDNRGICIWAKKN